MRDGDDPAVIAPVDPADRPPRFRWRVLPMLGCGLFGGISLLATLGGAVMLVTRAQRAADPAGVLIFFAPGLALNATGGGLWIGAAMLWWRGRWGWASGLSATGLAFFVTADQLPM